VITRQEAFNAKLAIMAATKISGHSVLEANTPMPAAMTAKLLMASLRVHSQTERILSSPSRNRINNNAQITLAISARVPNAPMVTAPGKVPELACQVALAMTNNPNRPIDMPVTNAAPARHRRFIPNTQRDSAEFAELPK